MSQSINWDTLETQYFADGHYRERLAKMVTIVDDAFMAGQHFAKHFNESMHELRDDIRIAKQPTQSAAAPTSTNIVAEELTKSKRPSVGVSSVISTVLTESTTKLISFISPNDTSTTSDTPTPPTQPSLALSSPSQQSTVDNKIVPVAHQTIDTTKVKWWEREALQFMRGVMDECTHLKNFSVPYDTSLITAICAKDDAYVLRDGCSRLEDVWPGAEVKYLDAGHVSAYVLHQKIFR